MCWKEIYLYLIGVRIIQRLMINASEILFIILLVINSNFNNKNNNNKNNNSNKLVKCFAYTKIQCQRRLATISKISKAIGITVVTNTLYSLHIRQKLAQRSYGSLPEYPYFSRFMAVGTMKASADIRCCHYNGKHYQKEKDDKLKQRTDQIFLTAHLDRFVHIQ